MKSIANCVAVTPMNYPFVHDIMLPSWLANSHEIGDDVNLTMFLRCQQFTDDQLESLRTLIRDANLASNLDVVLRPEADFIPAGTNGLNWINLRKRAVVPGHDYYLLTDDDFEFVEGSFSAYRKFYDHMEATPSCSSVMGAGALGSGGRGQDIEPYLGLSWINRGLMMRNLELVLPEHFDTIFSREMLAMKTSTYDDIAMSMYPMKFGFHYAKQFKHPSRHYHLPPPATEKEFMSPRIPARVREYFRHKVNFQATQYDPTTWFSSDEHDLFSTMADVAKMKGVMTHGSTGYLVPSNKFIRDVYRPAAIERFGEALV